MVRYSFLVGLFHPRLHRFIPTIALPYSHGSVCYCSGRASIPSRDSHGAVMVVHRDRTDYETGILLPAPSEYIPAWRDLSLSSSAAS